MLNFPGPKLYAGMVALGIVDLVWIYAAGHSINVGSLYKPMMTAIICLFGGMLCAFSFTPGQNGKRLISSPRLVALEGQLSSFFQGMLFLAIGWCVLRLFNHVTMTVPFPYADDTLSRLDQYLFLDWNKYFQSVANSPLLITIFDYAYSGLTPVSFLAFIVLIAMNRIAHARFFVVAFTITAVFCTIVGMFFPAQAAVAFLLDDKELISNFPSSPGTYSVEILERLRSGDPIVFDVNYLPGLTTFPSFHTAAGIIITYAYRGSILFWLVALYTAIMIASTPVNGGHYFVDIIFGTIVALSICHLISRSSEFKELFQRHGVKIHKEATNNVSIFPDYAGDR